MSENTTGHDVTPKRARAKPVAAKEFKTIYQASESVAEVAEKTGLTVHTVSQQASTYRKRGYSLPDQSASGHASKSTTSLSV
jgi:transposase